MQNALQGEACTERPACTVFLLSEPALLRSYWNYISTNRIQAFPVRLELCSYITISIFTGQSGSTLTNKGSAS